MNSKMKVLKIAGLIGTALLIVVGVERINDYFKQTDERLYMVIRHYGKIGGYAGPLPYSDKECEDRIGEYETDKQETLKVGINAENKLPLTEKERANLQALTFTCEWHSSKPVLEIKD